MIHPKTQRRIHMNIGEKNTNLIWQQTLREPHNLHFHVDTAVKFSFFSPFYKFKTFYKIQKV